MDLLAYPVSIVMKFWHWVLSFIVDPDSGIAWAGAVLLLVVTVRVLLLRSMWRQQYSMRKMSQIAPQMKELQKKYKDKKDTESRQAQAEEMKALYADAGVNPAAGCLPLLVQIPVFLGLYHVLLNFSPPGKSIDEAATMSNGAFGPEQVSSFLHAEIFGVPLSAYIRMPPEVLESLHPGLTRDSILMLAVPLFVLAGVATFINMWNSFRRQQAAKKAEEEALAMAEAEERAGGPVVDGEVVSVTDADSRPEHAPVEDSQTPDSNEAATGDETARDVDESGRKEPETSSGSSTDAAADPVAAATDRGVTSPVEKNDEESTTPAKEPELPERQDLAEAMQESMTQSMKIMMYLFPFFPIVGAIFLNFPIAIGLYWLTNNVWTAIQSHIFMERLEKELPMSSKDGLPPSAFM